MDVISYHNISRYVTPQQYFEREKNFTEYSPSLLKSLGSALTDFT
jgi:hypothetical protein